MTKRKIVSEKLLERKLCSAVKAAGGKAIKLSNGIENGLPDREILLPAGLIAEARVFFAEIKTTGKNLSPLQEVKKQELELLGFTVFVVDDYETLEAAKREMGI